MDLGMGKGVGDGWEWRVAAVTWKAPIWRNGSVISLISQSDRPSCELIGQLSYMRLSSRSLTAAGRYSPAYRKGSRHG